MCRLPRAPLPQTNYAQLGISVNKKRGQCTSQSDFPKTERIRVKILNIPEMEPSYVPTPIQQSQPLGEKIQTGQIVRFFKSKKCGGVSSFTPPCCETDWSVYLLRSGRRHAHPGERRAGGL